MTALLITEAMRLREALKLTRAESDILCAVLSTKGVTPRVRVRCDNSRSFDVLLTRLNQKLPATIRVVPHYDEGERFIKGRQGSNKASGYSISNEWGRDQLLRIARGRAKERAA